MLQPRETDIPALILVLVVLPLVTYILLGQWSEAAKKKEKISLFAQLAAEEAFKAEAMATATVIPLVPSSKNGIHECARCCGPATTRCARCKSVWYCSGRCQIIHWRQVHKQDCQQLEYNSNNSSPMSSSNKEFIHERDLLDDLESRCFRYNIKQPRHEKIPSDDIIHPASATAACMTMDTSGVLMMERRSIDKKVSRKSKRESSKREDGAIVESSEEASRHRATCSTSSNITPSKEAYMRHKFKESESMSSKEEIPEKNFNILSGNSNGHATSRSSMHGKSHKSQNQKDLIDGETEIIDGGSLLRDGITSNDETKELNCSLERTSMKKNNKAKSASHSLETNMYKSPKTAVKASREQSCSDKDRTGQIADESKFARIRDTIHAQGGNGVASMGIMKMIGLMRSSKPDRLDCSEVNGFRHKKIKMLFPYEEFVKLFRFEVFDLSPRGLVNCGNSCYANAVLQCLICTKPLTIYLLRRSHSRSCCVRDWCLICELEQHVMMLRENGGPLSPNGILLHMRSINCQIGDGSQEDAHEFLRLLVTSMQSICLEGLGGENVVDLRLQETTFIQHTFGGRLRSKVKCLRCHHESEQYENIMDLTLEIFGWVESLEDALTQFTSTEDLDGENMYRCGRCAAYVRARKQLSIQEAPNILTIVLKRFQEGSYGKINKCITFPDMLDMIPFMCGTDDIPPLYMLYAVVVHLDTLNASFSGHYISYVKDLQGNWFRIDDSQVQPVPMSQVMSEGAYILFYMRYLRRSCPRPARSCTGKPARHQDPGFAKQWAPKTPKRLRSEQSKTSLTRNSPQMMEGYGESRSMEFSDATSSDCSIFTCSDDASFTTESTRDSFSTVDYADACNIDPFSSIFNTTLYTPDYSSHKTVSCSRFSSSKPQTRFVSEGKNSIMDSYLSSQSLDGFKNLKQGNVPSAGAFPPGSHCGVHVKYQSNPKGGTLRTSGNCKL